MSQPPTLDCQACGSAIKELTKAEAQIVADNPYNYVAFCFRHKEEAKYYDRI